MLMLSSCRPYQFSFSVSLIRSKQAFILIAIWIEPGTMTFHLVVEPVTVVVVLAKISWRGTPHMPPSAVSFHAISDMAGIDISALVTNCLALLLHFLYYSNLAWPFHLKTKRPIIV